MKENICLSQFPKEAGVYFFVTENEEVIYVGSTKNLKKRMLSHLQSIQYGSNHGTQKELYRFLQENQFTVEFELTSDYIRKEQEYIESLKPIFNKRKAYTGIKNVNKLDYYKDWHKQYREDHLKMMKDYDNQLCLYDGKIITFNALRLRLKKQGVKHSCKEAKKYLIPSNVIDGTKHLIEGLEKILKILN